MEVTSKVTRFIYSNTILISNVGRAIVIMLIVAVSNHNDKIDVNKAALDNEIILENHYYAFGMTFGGNVWMNDAADIDNRYQYNGKELNNDHSLGWYNYGARFYDMKIWVFMLDLIWQILILKEILLL